MNWRLKKYWNTKSLLIITPLLIFIIILSLTSFNGLYGQDSHEYYRYSKALLNFFKTGNSPGDYFWPVYYPLIGAMLGLVLDNLLSLQLISVLTLSGSLFFLYKIMKEIFGEKKFMTIYLLITFLFSPFILRSSLVVMSDMITVFFISASFYFFIDYQHKQGVKQILFFSLFSVLAVLTRYASAIILLIPSMIIIYNILKERKLFHLIIIMVTVLVIAIPHVLIREWKSAEFLNHFWLQEWSLSNFFKNDFVTSEGIQHYRFPNILNSFSNIFFPTYLVFGLVLVVLAERNLPNNRVWFFSIGIVLLNALFLSGIPFQNHRYLLLSYPFVVVVVFPGFERLVNLLHKRKILNNAVFFLMLCIQIFYCHYFLRPVYERNILEKEISEFVKKNKHQNVYAFDIDVSFMSYNIDKNIFSLWKEKIKHFKDDSIVIFNEDKFKIQWANMNPMLNWEELKASHTIIKLKDFCDGWMAYEIR